MKKLVYIIIFLVTVTAEANPIIDPATCFTHYPWNTNRPWLQQQRTNRMIEQLWYTLTDRARAVGILDRPYYTNDYTLYAGIYTGYTYVVTNVQPTNTWVVTNRPSILLRMTNGYVNAIYPFTYEYPTQPGVDFCPLTNAVGYTYVDKRILDEFLSTLELVAPNYVVSQAGTNLDLYFGTAVSNRYPDVPMYCMAQLCKDAGYTNKLSNLTDNGFGILIVPTEWDYTYARFNTASSGVYIVTMAGLNELAAMIAQLKYVRLKGVACNPGLTRDVGYLSVANQWNYTYDVTTPFTKRGRSEGLQEYTMMPFGWFQTSWSNLTATVTPTSFTNDYKYHFDVSIPKQGDWPLSGWYAYGNYHVTFDSYRDDTGSSTTLYWRVCDNETDSNDRYGLELFTVSNRETYVQADDIQAFAQRMGLDWGSPRGEVVDKYWTSWEFDTADIYSITNTFNPYTVDSSNANDYATTSITVTNLITTNAPYTNIFTLYGEYDYNKTNPPPTVRATKELSWTNLGLITNFSYTYTDIRSVTETNLIGVHQEATTNYSDPYTTTNYYWLAVDATNGLWAGYASIILSPDVAYGNGYQYYLEADSIRTDMTPLWTNCAGTAKIYLHGCEFGLFTNHYKNTFLVNSYGQEWTNENYGYLWLTNAYSSFGIYSNRYSNVSNNMAIPSDVTLDQFECAELKYKAFYDYYWQPDQVLDDGCKYDYYGKWPRGFYGIRDVVFIVDYAFSNRFYK